jgi:hypothetical protein
MNTPFIFIINVIVEDPLDSTKYKITSVVLRKLFFCPRIDEEIRIDRESYLVRRVIHTDESNVHLMVVSL